VFAATRYASELEEIATQRTSPTAHQRSLLRRLAKLLADEEYCSTEKARQLLGVASVNTVKAWIASGLLDATRLPTGRWKIRMSSIERLREQIAATEARRRDGNPMPSFRPRRRRVQTF
jgi:hypothetical protein